MVMSIVRDITESKRAREARKLFDSNPDAVILASSGEGRYLQVNDALCDLIGYSREEIIGTTERDLGIWVDDEMSRAREIVAEKGVVRHFPCRLRAKSGKQRDVLLSVENIEVEGQLCMLAVVQDITERKQAEEALRRALERYEQQVRLFEGVASTTPDFVYVFDLQGRFLYANSRLLEVWGMDLPYVIGKTCRELGYEQWHHDMHMREIAQVIETKRPIKGEVPFKAPRTGLFGVYEYIFTPVIGPNSEVELIAGTTRDVTERKNAEEALKDIEARLRLATEATGLGTFDFLPQTGELIWSDYAKLHFGLSPDAHVDYNLFLRGLHPDDRERVGRIVQDTIRPGSGSSYKTEYRTIGMEDGKERWLEARGSVFFDDQNRPVRFIGSTLDITERKKVERALQEALARAEEGQQTFEAMMEYVPMGITIADAPDVRIRAISRYGRELTAKPGEQIEGIPVEFHSERWQVYRKDGVTPARNEELPLPRATQKGELVMQEEWVIGRPDGTKVPILCTAAPIRDSEGKVIGGVVGWQDITERKRVEEALRRRGEEFRGLVENAPDVISVFDRDLRRIYVNSKVRENTGQDVSFMMGKTLTEAGYPDSFAQPLNAAIQHLFATGKEETIELGYEAPKGRIWLQIRCTPLHAADGSVERVMSIGRDITERKLMEEELRRSRDELEIHVWERTAELRRRNEELQNFTFAASHDLQEPLRKIQTFSDLIASKFSHEISEQGRDYLRRMHETAARMRDVLQSLMKYSRLTAEPESFERVDLNEVAGEVISDMNMRIRQIGASVEIADLPEIEADAAQMRLLLQNLLDNALEYTREGEQTKVKIYSNCSGMPKNGECKIYVEDNGIGFEEKYLELIFKPYNRLHGKNEYGGVGMGLAICAKVVEHHQGKITAKSTPGQGSTFIVTLPVSQARP